MAAGARVKAVAIVGAVIALFPISAGPDAASLRDSVWIGNIGGRSSAGNGPGQMGASELMALEI
jgi:hypothetical protein